MKPVLVDTSVWRRFFAGTAAFRGLGDLLDEDEAVLVHPFVVGELVMGGLSSKHEAHLQRLPRAPVLAHEEVLGLVRRQHLVRRDLGWVDAHLLASALVSSALLWSADKDLAAAAVALTAAFRPPAS